MALLVALLLLAAVILMVLHALPIPSRVNLGWLGIACVVAAVWMLPALTRVG